MTSICHHTQQRIRWLAELDHALATAARLARQIDAQDLAELQLLREQIARARAELELIRRGALPGMTANSPEWINSPAQRRDLSENAAA